MNKNSLSRRDVLKGAAAVAVSTGAAAELRAAASPSATRPTLHVYDNYGWLRGFGVIPSWGARIEDAWWDYDGSRMREEIAPAKLLHANCIRLWIEFSAWMANPDKVTANFHDAVAAIGEAGMKVMPCLFNRWHDFKYDYGGTYIENLLFNGFVHDGTRFSNLEIYAEYVRALVTPLAKDDRVLIWDLCNEPHAGVSISPEMQIKGAEEREYEWLAHMAKTVRDCGVQQPVSIGTMFNKNIEFYAGLCDVLCAHPYATGRAELEKKIAELKVIQQKHNKPLMANECISGAENDKERGALAAICNDLLGAAGFGWMGWVLREGRAVATRRDRIDPNGIRSYGFHPWVLKNGKLRDGLEALTDKPKLLPPWQKI